MKTNKKVYVNGSIIITTRYFAPIDIGVGYQTPPEGAEIIEPSNVFEGVQCLLIDDEHPQSLFKEYYAKDDVASGYLESSYLSASFFDCINDYKKRITEIGTVIHKVSDWDNQSRLLVYKMSFVNVLTALDAFLCYVLLLRSIHSEELFHRFMFSLAPKSKREYWKKLIECDHLGEWEQDAIRFVQETSFINTKRIDEAIKQLGFDSLVYNRDLMEEFYKTRHLLVHRNGRQRDDDEVVISYQSLADLINGCHHLVGAIFDSVIKLASREKKNKPEEKDIEEVFPGGVVRVPFKMSDLSRLLIGNNNKVPIEPLELPVL